MIEATIKEKRKLCFLVMKGDANDIVIPIETLAAIDYRRLAEMEAEGGELMKVMRETTLDNGKNALTQYQHLLVTVPKNVEKKVEADKVEPSKAPEVKVEETSEAKPRGRGRPKKEK